VAEREVERAGSVSECVQSQDCAGRDPRCFLQRETVHPAAVLGGAPQEWVPRIPGRLPFEYPSDTQPSTDSGTTQQFWKVAQTVVHWRKQTMSILFGIAALIASIGLLVLCSGVGIFFLSNSKSKLAGRL